MSALFLSDLHLDKSRPKAINYFIDTLSNLDEKISSIYILGDLVEYWVGDDDPAEGLNEVFEAIYKKTSSTPIYFMHGNRDFLITENFCKKFGMKLLNDPTIITLYGEKILLMHGDTLCTDDIEYQNYRKVVRSTSWQEEMLKKSLEERLIIAESLRKKSLEETKGKSEEIMDVNDQEVKNIFKKYNVNILIHGHTHRPNIHELQVDNKNVKRIVLGDWYEGAYLLEYNAGKIIIDKKSLFNQKSHNF
ncbi:MAG: UDP-2,3-diacylglucosamine diphosphatase [Pseudomonadota bacterium]|nr:UDP-2,3-diacylglucosamine diphosphatase [Pseudomonadota bacterium]